MSASELTMIIEFAPLIFGTAGFLASVEEHYSKQKDRPKAALYSNCKPGALVVRSPQRRIYFGRIVGSPPGLPCGGMTGILPVSGVGARISGSTPVGGQSTPSDLASLSLSGSACGAVVVVSSRAPVPCCGIDCVGAQPVAFLAGAGGAV